MTLKVALHNIGIPVNERFDERGVSVPFSHAGELQDLGSLASYLNQYGEEQFLQAVSDFNVLLFLCNCDVLPLKEHLAPLLHAVKTQNMADALQWFHGEQWSTMQHLLQASGIYRALCHVKYFNGVLPYIIVNLFWKCSCCQIFMKSCI